MMTGMNTGETTAAADAMTTDKVAAQWDEKPVDISNEANFIWGIANKARSAYTPDKYGDIILPMVVVRRFECTLQETKAAVMEKFQANPAIPAKVLQTVAGYKFYNTSEFTLARLLNDPDNIAENFKSYIRGFSKNVQDILAELELSANIEKMDKEDCLYPVVEAFSELDLDPKHYDSIKMGHIFENLLGRFYENIDQGQFYTPRDLVRALLAVLVSEGCEDFAREGRGINVGDYCCGTGGMLFTAYDYLKHINPSAAVRLFGQEIMGQTYAVGLAEMLIKGQDTDHFQKEDTLKEDCFRDDKMRLIATNVPFGIPWGGKDAKTGQEKAVKEEFAKGKESRWSAGLPATSDSQLLFLQAAVNKLESNGRCGIILNASPLFSGGTASGESQIRRWLLEKDLVEAIIAISDGSFINTGIGVYFWIISKQKRPERAGKIQLIDATSFCHKLRKPMGKKSNEITPEDREQIVSLYHNFEENEYCKIFDNEEFIYKEYAVMEPLQRSYMFNSCRYKRLEKVIEGMVSKKWHTFSLAELEQKYGEYYEHFSEMHQERDDHGLLEYPLVRADWLLAELKKLWAQEDSEKKYMEPETFLPELKRVLQPFSSNKKLLDKVADGLSEMDKSAVIQRDKKGNIIYDKETKDVELVNIRETIEDYMQREVWPHKADAQWFWEEDLSKKNPVIKTGAEIPFTRYFYKYQKPQATEELQQQFQQLEAEVQAAMAEIFG